MNDRPGARRAARQARAAFVSALAPVVRAGLQQSLARRILAHLPTHPFVMASYLAMGDEIDPLAVHAACPRAAIAYPRVQGPGTALAFHVVPMSALVPGPLGIPAPAASAPPAIPAVLLVPLLAADPAGNRLGQGGGFYDRTLASLRAAAPILAVGIGWDVQVVERIEPAPWDQPLDAVATPTAFIWCRDPAMRPQWN